MSQSDLPDTDWDHAESTVLVDALGGNAKVRILAVLVSEYDRDLNPTEICEQAGIGSSTFYNHIDDLRRWGLVEQTRMAGNSPMYQINHDSEAAERFANFEWGLIKFLAEKEKRGEVDTDNRPVLADDASDTE